MARSTKVKAEEPLESLLAGDDFLDPQDLGFLHTARGNVASSKCPRFSQSGHSCPVDGSARDEGLLGRRADGPLGDGFVEQEVEDLEADPLDSCFGLLGTMHQIVPQGHIDQLPDEILQEIFALVPAVSLYQDLSLVCRRWQRIISDPQFIPWKKLYHKYLKAEVNALSSIEKILQKYGLIEDQKQRMLGFIRCLASIKSRCSWDPEAILQCLKSHPFFPKAEICIAKRLPDLESPTSRVSYVWAVMATMVLFSGGVPDIRDLVACLRRPSSTLSLTDITEALYCMATLLYAMRENKVHISSRIHYSIFYCLYLLENSNCAVTVITPELFHFSDERSLSPPAVQLTYEQQKILNHEVAPGQVVKIMAFAGTGKTSTLIKYAEKWSNLKFLYLAFNKTIADQAGEAFPPNVTCKTIHSLAYAEVGKRFSYSKKLNPGSLTTYCVSFVLRNRKGMSLFVRAKTVIRTLATFFASADDTITSEHTPVWCKDSSGMRVLVQAEEQRIIMEEAEQIWSNMKLLNPTKEMAYKMTHDGYLKLWQLERPLLSGYDAIFVDEAQDCTPAIMHIIRSQLCGVILVGDPHQQIYSFRGAVNTLSEIPHSHIFYLTQSFRFGPEIAYVAATILDVCKKDQKKILVGNDQEGDISGTNVPEKVARLSRNNHTVFDDAVNVTGQEPPAKIHLLGGLKAFGLEKILDIWRLLHPELKSEVRDPFLKLWVKKGFAGIKEYVANAEDKQLEIKIAIVESYRDHIPELVKRISQCHVHALEMADYILGTVHKAKGLEFDTVQIASDFFQGSPAPPSYGRLPMYPAVPDDEWNLLYVAITRAKRCLIMPTFLSHFLTWAGEYYLRPELTSEVCKEVPPPCSGRGCYNSILAASILTMKKMPFVYSDGTNDPGGFLCHHCVNQCLGSLVWLTVSPEDVNSPENVFVV